MGFLSPWFLGGLAALGVPIFVHLLRRHVSVPRPVSSLMFFERGTQSSTRHRRLRHLLLFALRSALILLLVLAFANPFLRRAAAGANGRLLVIVLDRSFSMRAGSRFDEAKTQALATLSAKPSGQKAQIIALGGNLDVLTQPIADATQLRAALESIQPGDGRSNYGELGRDLHAMSSLGQSPADLHLFTDVQRSSMPANFADMVMPTNIKLTLHSVAPSAAPSNWTVESVDAPAELSDPKDPKRSRVKAVIAAFNASGASKTVDLVVNGKTIASRKIVVPANGHASVEFAPLDVGYGFNRCEIRIEGGDAFPADDASVFTVRRADPERVLFIHAANDTRSAVYFGAALDAAAHSSFILQSVAAEQATDLDPTHFAFVVLSDAATLPSIFEHALQAYAMKGGNVLIALGTAAAHQKHIPLWGDDAGSQLDLTRSSGEISVGQIDFSAPILAESQPGNDNGGWAPVKIFFDVPIDPKGARVTARLTNGTPLLLEKQFGEGRLVLLTTGLDNITNDMPLHPVFVALVDRAARTLSGTEQLSGARLVDSFVQLRSNTQPTGSNGSVEVIDPDGHRPLSLSEARTARSVPLTRAGFYQVHFANGRDGVIGVNPDRRESNLEPMPQDLLNLWAGSSDNSPTTAGAAPDENRVQMQSFWWYVMLLALLALIGETFVASGYMGTLREDP